MDRGPAAYHYRLSIQRNFAPWDAKTAEPLCIGTKGIRAALRTQPGHPMVRLLASSSNDNTRSPMGSR